MEIKFIKPTEESVLIPLINNGTTIHFHLAEFLVKRFHSPSLTSIKKARPLKSLESIKSKAYHLKRFLENLDANGKDYLNVDFSTIYELLEKICESNIDHKTFNNMYSNIREFYDFLDIKNIPYRAEFPEIICKTRYINDNQNLLSHTNSTLRIEYDSDSGKKPTHNISSYRDRIFSKTDADKLYTALNKIDPIYTVIAKTMIQTYLRISNICEMPLYNDKRNKLILFPELQAHNIDKQNLRINAKGQKVYSIPLYRHTSELIYNDYIVPYFDERKELFRNNYLSRKNATLSFGGGKRSAPDDILWLTSKGAPIKPYMITNAFKETGLGITPHMCRHTGVTHTLHSFCKLNGIKPSEALSGRFMKILQEILGHVSYETTLLYIHTIEDIEVLHTLQYSLPKNKLELDDSLKQYVSEKVLTDIEQWYGD